MLVVYCLLFYFIIVCTICVFTVYASCTTALLQCQWPSRSFCFNTGWPKKV